MSKRYGRNQKRKHLKRIDELEKRNERLWGMLNTLKEEPAPIISHFFDSIESAHKQIYAEVNLPVLMRKAQIPFCDILNSGNSELFSREFAMRISEDLKNEILFVTKNKILRIINLAKQGV